MPDVDKHIVNLLAGLVHLRILEFDQECPTEDVDQFIVEVSDRVPHLEYISIHRLDHYYKRVGGELVICDGMEHSRFEL
jgi:hypothetical protein